MPLWLWRGAAWGAGVLPLCWGLWLTLHASLGANPVEFLEHFTGDWSLRLLLLTLAMTPLRRLTGALAAIRVRRILGLWAFSFVCLHLSLYLVFDLEFSLRQLSEDWVKRRYITVGLCAWLLLVPLAVTSTQGWQRRLKRRWKTLHRLAYAAALLGALHYLWLVKADTRTPLVYLAVFVGLMLLRLPWPLRPSAATSVAPSH